VTVTLLKPRMCQEKSDPRRNDQFENLRKFIAHEVDKDP